MTTFYEAFEAAQAVWYSPDIAESITYNGKPIYAHIEGGYERLESSIASTQLSARVQKSDVPAPKVDDIVIYDGTQYRTGEGATLDGGDWVIPLILDYIEV